MQGNSIVDSLMGDRHEVLKISPQTTKLSNEYIDMYLEKKQVLCVVDKRDMERQKVYNSLRTALHYLKHKTSDT
jgi:hypothetical protein